MLRAIVVFGVLLVAVAGNFGRGGFRGRIDPVGSRSRECLRNASDSNTNTSMSVVERRQLDGLIIEASRNATREVCRRNSTRGPGNNVLPPNDSDSDDSDESGQERQGLGLRRGGRRGFWGRGGRGRGICGCRMNQTQFQEYTSQMQTLINNEAPVRFENYTTSGAQNYVNSYIACMDATEFDANGNIVRRR